MAATEFPPERQVTPELARLLAMAPRRFLDDGHDLAGLFDPDEGTLDFLAEAAISDRLLKSPAEKEPARARAAAHLADPLPPHPPEMDGYFQETLAARRWHAEIVNDDAFAERVAAALPEDCRKAQEDHVDRFLRPIVLVAVDSAETPTGPKSCGLCGQPIARPHVQLVDRRGHYNGDENSDRDYRIYSDSFDRALAAICSTCLPPIPDVTLALSRFYLEVQHAVGDAAIEGRTVEGVAKAVKKLGQSHRLRVADELPLPGLSRKERGR